MDHGPSSDAILLELGATARYDSPMPLTRETITERLELAEALRLGRSRTLTPQDLPGRYGQVVNALDRVLQSCGCNAVLAGGWAVWRHGFLGRVTQDVDVVVAASDLDDVLQTASVSGFDVPTSPAGHWPKLLHRETQINVDLLPEGARPGTASRPAPTTIPDPRTMGATSGKLSYIELPPLVELKLAAGRIRDEADIVELIRENRDEVIAITQHLEGVHAEYATRFGELVERAEELESPPGAG